MYQIGDIKMYSPTDICEKLHIGRAKCYKLFRLKDFGAVTIGNKFLVSEENLCKFLNSGKRIK